MHDDHPPQGRVLVLVVDDNEDAATTLSLLLELVGHRTGTAYNGQDAVTAAAENRYDAVLLDLNMPVMDGFEAARVLGQLRPAPKLIVCSALGCCRPVPSMSAAMRDSARAVWLVGASSEFLRCSLGIGRRLPRFGGVAGKPGEQFGAGGKIDAVAARDVLDAAGQLTVLGPCIAVQPQHVPTGGGINRMSIQGHDRQCRSGGRRSRLAVVSLRSQIGIGKRACRL